MAAACRRALADCRSRVDDRIGFTCDTLSSLSSMSAAARMKAFARRPGFRWQVERYAETNVRISTNSADGGGRSASGSTANSGTTPNPKKVPDALRERVRRGRSQELHITQGCNFFKQLFMRHYLQWHRRVAA
jgi:hypothetical protein